MSAGLWRNGPGMQHLGSSHNYNSNYASDQHSTWGTADEPESEGGSLRDRYEALKGYFGELKAGKRRIMEETYEKENSDYPEAFSLLYGGGRDDAFDDNGHLERVLIEKTIGTKNWWLSRMAPWKHHAKSLTFSWSKTIFSESMLDRLPEEATPRLHTARRTGGSASMLRYGTALLLEATFMETPAGRQTYIMNLEQMRVACVQTASYGVMVSIMEHTPYEDPFRRRQAGEARGDRDFNQIDKELQDECDQWGIVHKHPAGLRLVLEKMRATLANRGRRANFTMLPQGMAAFQAGLEAQNRFFVSGHATSKDVERSLSEDVVCESHAFNMGEGEPCHDPMVRHRTIGAFAVLSDISMHDEPVEEYRTKHMNTVMYDQDQDEFFMAKYAHGYKFTGTWDFTAPDARLSKEIGAGVMFGFGCYTYGQLYRKCVTSAERAVDKIYMLPESKRQAFFDALPQLLPKDSDLVNLGGAPFPEARDYSRRKLHELIDGDLELDENRPQLISVPEHRANAGRAGSFTRADIERRAAYARKLDAISRKRKFDGEGDHEDAHTDEELYEREQDDMDLDEDMYGDGDMKESQVLPASYARVGPGLIAKTSNATVNVRRTRRRVHHATDQALRDGTGINLAALSDRVIESAPDSVVPGGTRWLTEYATAIRAMAATDAQKAALLTELARVVKGCVYFFQFEKRDKAINAAFAAAKLANTNLEDVDVGAIARDPANAAKPWTLQELQTEVTGSFAAFAARVDLRAAIDNTGDSKTPLEDACADATTSLHRSFPLDVLTRYRWTPDGTKPDVAEDGQISLLTFAPSNGVALPTDAFAATLAAHHNVLFDIDPKQRGDLLLKFEPALDVASNRQDRLRALTWSIALSVLAPLLESDAVVDAFDDVAKVKTARQGPPPAAGAGAPAMAAWNAKGTVATFIASLTNASVKKRLVEFAKAHPTASKRAVLTCQQHLQPFIAGLHECLVEGLSAPGPNYAQLPVNLYAAQKHANSLKPISTSTYPSPAIIDVDAKKKKPMADRFQANNAAGLSLAAPAVAAADQAWSKANIADLLDRAAVSSGLLFKFCVDNDIPVPFSLTVWRPNKCHSMMSALSMVAGSGTNAAARTFYQNPNMMVAGNAAQKMFFGHFTLYFKTLVFNPESIVIMRDIFTNGYIGGNGRRSWNPFSNNHTNAFASGDLSVASMFWTFGSMNSAESPHWWRSFTGEMPESMPCTAEVRESVRYEGCEAVAQFWGYRTDGRTSYSPDAPYSCVNNPNDRKHNVLCLQDWQQTWNPATKAYSTTILNRGHWGKNACYPGAADVMRGVATHFDVPDYMPVKKTQVV